jgi:lactoylglutathione lyase
MPTVDYVIRYVDDLERGVAFYRDLLGLEHRFTDHGYAEFAAGPTKLALMERSRVADMLGRDAPGGGWGGEILFLVEEVDAEAARLRDAGVEIVAGPEDRPWGHRTLHVLDPEGHLVELAQEIDRSDR